MYSTNTVEIVSNDRGHVKTVRVVSGHRDENRVFIADEGSEHDLPADLVIFAMGFAHPEYDGVVAELGLELDGRGNIVRMMRMRLMCRGFSPAVTLAAGSPLWCGPSRRDAQLLTVLMHISKDHRRCYRSR
ncbi:glutamate synthase [Cutibacterium acnes JCM 18909]|nr:glutamate synthase [Cutibacterium acnes JCM 18909]